MKVMGFESKIYEGVTPAVIKSAKLGNANAQKLIYDCYSTMVYGTAKRIFKDTGYADDILQETFIDVFTKINTFRGESPLGPWIRKIARNRCLMLLRSSWIAKHVDIEIDNNKFVSSHEEKIINEQELELALATLSVQARAVVLLHDVEGFKHKEIANMMGKTESFSKSQLARAHARLKVFLKELNDEDKEVKCSLP
jgi:RNA polymerase sigma-70 factor (ECF subfamily)